MDLLKRNQEGRIPQNWKGGINNRYYMRLARDYIDKICSKCGSAKNLLVHHKNYDHGDNRLENLEIVCKSCHEKTHNKAKNFTHNVFWTEKDIAFLKANYMSMTDTELGKHLKRTPSSIELKRKRLRLKKSSWGRPKTEVN